MSACAWDGCDAKAKPRSGYCVKHHKVMYRGPGKPIAMPDDRSTVYLNPKGNQAGVARAKRRLEKLSIASGRGELSRMGIKIDGQGAAA